MMTDKTTIRIVVGALALAVLAGLGIMGALALLDHPIPDQLDRLVTVLSGGLIGVLASTRSTLEEPDGH
jgi:hypothetical protein